MNNKLLLTPAIVACSWLGRSQLLVGRSQLLVGRWHTPPLCLFSQSCPAPMKTTPLGPKCSSQLASGPVAEFPNNQTRGGSVVKSTSLSKRTPAWLSASMSGGLQLPTTANPGYRMLSFDFWVLTHISKTYIHTYAYFLITIRIVDIKCRWTSDCHSGSNYLTNLPVKSQVLHAGHF